MTARDDIVYYGISYKFAIDRKFSSDDNLVQISYYFACNSGNVLQQQLDHFSTNTIRKNHFPKFINNLREENSIGEDQRLKKCESKATSSTEDPTAMSMSSEIDPTQQQPCVTNKENKLH